MARGDIEIGGTETGWDIKERDKRVYILGNRLRSQLALIHVPVTYFTVNVI